MIGKIIGSIVVVLAIITVFYWYSHPYPSEEPQTNTSEQSNSDKQHTMTLYPSPSSLKPEITLQMTLSRPPSMPTPPKLPVNPDSDAMKVYDQKKTEYEQALQQFYKKLEEYNEEQKHTTSVIETVRYGGMTLKTDELELQIHKLINDERAKYNLKPLSYNFEIANIARKHSFDMISHDYFAHEDQDGKGPAERGYPYGYKECGDKNTIQLMKEYDQLLKQFEATGNTDIGMHNQLESMRNQLNSAIQKEMVFDGLSENIFQTYLYDQYWETDGVITSYDWNAPEEIVRSTVEGWMNSEGHRMNILTPYYESEGIGVDIDSDSKVLITQNFC